MLNRYTSNTRPFSVDLGQPKTSFLQPGLQPSHVERSSICRRFDPESMGSSGLSYLSLPCLSLAEAQQPDFTHQSQGTTITLAARCLSNNFGIIYVIGFWRLPVGTPWVAVYAIYDPTQVSNRAGRKRSRLRAIVWCCFLARGDRSDLVFFWSTKWFNLTNQIVRVRISNGNNWTCYFLLSMIDNLPSGHLTIHGFQGSFERITHGEVAMLPVEKCLWITFLDPAQRQIWILDECSLKLTCSTKSPSHQVLFKSHPHDIPMISSWYLIPLDSFLRLPQEQFQWKVLLVVLDVVCHGKSLVYYIYIFFIGKSSIYKRL